MLPETQARQVGQLEAAQAGDVAERIGAGRVAKRRGIRHGADSDAVEHDPDYALKHETRM